MFRTNLKRSVAARTCFVVIDQVFYPFWESKQDVGRGRPFRSKLKVDL